MKTNTLVRVFTDWLLPRTQETAVIPYHRRPVIITQPKPVEVIEIPMINTISFEPLSDLIERGLELNKPVRNKFVEYMPNGFIHNGQITYYRTCALAAAFVAGYGIGEVHPKLSESMVSADLESLIGYHPGLEPIDSPPLPTGSYSNVQRYRMPVAKLVMQLNDKHMWTRRAIARHLKKEGF